jgi:hypothetical protein
MNYIEELSAIIRRLHGVEANHLESVPVKETFQGKTRAARQGLAS